MITRERLLSNLHDLQLQKASVEGAIEYINILIADLDKEGEGEQPSPESEHNVSDKYTEG